MILFFIFVIIFALLFFLEVRIIINKFKISNFNIDKNNKYIDAMLGIYIFKKVPLLKIKLNKNKKISDKILKLNLKILKNKFEFKTTRTIFEDLKKVKVELKKFDLEIYIDTEDVIITSFLVPILATLISIILKNNVNHKSNEEIRYLVLPIYKNKNLYSIDFKSIICIKLVHIISVIKLLIKLGGSKKDEGTSNRRTYDYSHE